MFTLIKWAIILTFIGGIYFVYDVAKELSPKDRRAFHKDAIEALDSGDGAKFKEKVTEKITHEFEERKGSFSQKLRLKCKNFLEKFFDNDEN